MSPLPVAARPARRGPVPAIAGTGPRRPAAVIALLVLLVLLCVSGCGSASTKPSSSNLDHFGGYPSFLPKNTLNFHGDTVLTGTVQRPALTNQGDGVEVKTPHWSVLISVTGPEVPGEGLPYQAPSTTCTWLVTMSRATGPVPISPSDFTSIDDMNRVYQPQFVPGQPRPPGVLRPGEAVHFELRAAEAVGEGLMRWAPNGRNIVAKWDFVVEND